MPPKSLGQLARERFKRQKRRRKIGNLLSQWRRHGTKAFEEEPVMAASVVESVVSRLGLEDQLTEQDLTAAWTEIVGDFLATHSRPTGVRRNVLEVSVLQPAVMFTLDREMKPLIVKKLRERFGSERIRDIRFKVG